VCNVISKSYTTCVLPERGSIVLPLEYFHNDTLWGEFGTGGGRTPLTVLPLATLIKTGCCWNSGTCGDFKEHIFCPRVQEWRVWEADRGQLRGPAGGSFALTDVRSGGQTSRLTGNFPVVVMMAFWCHKEAETDSDGLLWTTANVPYKICRSTLATLHHKSHPWVAMHNVNCVSVFCLLMSDLQGLQKV